MESKDGNKNVLGLNIADALHLAFFLRALQNSTQPKDNIAPKVVENCWDQVFGILGSSFIKEAG